MVEVTKATRIKKTFAEGDLTAVFVEELGWESSTRSVPTVSIGETEFTPTVAASLKGFYIFAVSCDTLPSRQEMRQIDKHLSELSPERMEVFQSPSEWVWHWPRRTNGGTTTFEVAQMRPNVMPSYLAQRLAALEFSIADFRKGVTLADVRDRVHGRFDASPVTKKFYVRFADEQTKLAASIVGLPEAEGRDYSTTLLNRLMFIYFLQKKEFLNGDPYYLENTLKSIQQLRGPNHFYNFYKDALLPLFFEKLNDREGVVADPEVRRILGDVPYVNGGIFGKTDLEDQYAEELQIPDEAFSRVLSFFGEFNWHLDTRPTGNPNEINPEVIGYIFEQFINVAASGKKENGAYYTPHDVTAYMVAQTLVPRIFDDFEDFDSVLSLLRDDPDRYIQPAMLHGWDNESDTWREVPDILETCWLGDPLGWPLLDESEHDSEVCLPGETWVEMFHRRERVASLRERLAAGQVVEVNDLITENLNGQLLLTDAIDFLPDGGSVARLFNQVTRLSVFDPTCGSGAFLFGALEVLEDIYDHVIDRALALPESQEVAGIRDQVSAQPSKRYFVRKHIAIRNLYGTDLMPGAIETAKLRIFLALAACVDTRDELKPLPDLDFNLKVGNLVVGFKDSEDVYRIGSDILAGSRLDDLQPKINDYAALYSAFTKAVESDSPLLNELKQKLRSSEAEIRAECDDIYASLSVVEKASFDKWKTDSRPFHWFAEFPDIIGRGGFDVIIGNPPYVKMSQLPGYSVVGYETQRCPDLFAVCYERSLSLLAINGRHAFIVMLNLSFSEKFSPLRGVIGKREGAEWWSTYGKWPTQLFAGVRVANTILILGPGDKQHSTRHHIFGSPQRKHLFQSIHYSKFSREISEPPIRGGLSEPLLRAIRSLPLPAGPVSRESLFLRPTGQYWFPVLFGAPPVLNDEGEVVAELDPRLVEIKLVKGESRLISGAALAGKISYAWWSAVGDDFDCRRDEAEIGRKLGLAIMEDASLVQLAEKVRDAGQLNAFVSKNMAGYVNVRWINAREETDIFDRAAMETAGLLTHWRSLNIWYRQCMRSTRDNLNSRYLTEDEIANYLKW